MVFAGGEAMEMAFEVPEPGGVDGSSVGVTLPEFLAV